MITAIKTLKKKIELNHIGEMTDYKELNARIERLSYLGGGLYLELRGLLIPNGYYDEKHKLHGCGQSLMNLAQ